nr:MAG TPA: hypothetical protein [Caudoviricetes sp.]
MAYERSADSRSETVSAKFFVFDTKLVENNDNVTYFFILRKQVYIDLLLLPSGMMFT